MENNFSNWILWNNRNSLSGLNYPGVYCLAISEVDLSGKEFSWLSEIVYVGMTNSKAGLKGRLKQFDNTIIGKTGHGGADRFRFEHPNYNELIKKLYVAVSFFECDVNNITPKDLKQMGEVAKFEYICMAEYVKYFKTLPKFNDKKNSPKYSLTIGRRSKK